MCGSKQLLQIVGDLIGVLHLQAKALEELVERVEQVAGRVGDEHKLSVVASELSELQVRVKKLQQGNGH